MKNLQWFSLSPLLWLLLIIHFFFFLRHHRRFFRLSRRLTRFREFVVFIFHRATSKCFKAFCVKIRKIIENYFSRFLVAVWGPKRRARLFLTGGRKNEKKNLNYFFFGFKRAKIDFWFWIRFLSKPSDQHLTAKFILLLQFCCQFIA